MTVGGRDERSLGELFADLARDTSTLIRHELALAGTEMSQRASNVAKDVATLVVGGLVVYAGFLAIVAAAILALADLGLSWWLAALLVGVIVAVAGYLLVSQARTALKHADLLPRRTIDTLREDRA